MDELRNFVFVSIISADNDEFNLSEEDKQEILKRHKEDSDNWAHILEPIKDEEQRERLIRFLGGA